MIFRGQPGYYGDVDDGESIRAIHAALDAGVTLFDTADCYGAGHSEQVLGRALAQRRSEVVIATKFGNRFDPATRHVDGEDVTPGYIRQACQASLARLGTEVIDVYLIHCWTVSAAAADDAMAALESLCDEGLIRTYGWSTDDLAQVERLVGAPRFGAMQIEANVFNPGGPALELCARRNWGALARSPLAMGLLSGRYDANSRFSTESVRGGGQPWVKFFRDAQPAPEYLHQLDAVRELLQSGGRTLVQGALAYLWGRSPIVVPIPGFRNAAQARENAAAMEAGPLAASQVAEIDHLLDQVRRAEPTQTTSCDA